MVQLTDEQKNDDLLVKSLLDSGFTEEVIAGWIESGSIKLEKSVQSGPDDHGEGDGDGNHEKKEKDKDKKDPDKKEGEGDDDSDLEKGNGCGDGDKKKDDIAKSLSDDIIKSIEDSLFGKFNQSQDDLLKSIPAIVEKALEPITDKIEKSLDGMRQAIIAFGNSAPEFKSAGLSKAIIEKSIEQGGGAKDEDNKTVLSISRDRAVVRELIAKSIDEEADPEIQKSLRDNTTAYLLDPIGGDIGKDAALYMYNKKNVRLVK
jgi:hypothetical protein